MSLDVASLTADLVQVFEDGMQATSSAEVAQALANAIHNYVRQAEVNGVNVDVVDPASNPIGSGTQSAPVTIS